MINRCTNKKHPLFQHYGGRKIKVCSRWLQKDGFRRFIEDMGERPDGTTLDRIDNNGDYCPENCRWANWSEQSRNRTDNIVLRAFGREQCVMDWAKEIGIKPSTLYMRLSKGMPIEKALSRVDLRRG